MILKLYKMTTSMFLDENKYEGDVFLQHIYNDSLPLCSAENEKTMND